MRNAHSLSVLLHNAKLIQRGVHRVAFDKQSDSAPDFRQTAGLVCGLIWLMIELGP